MPHSMFKHVTHTHTNTEEPWECCQVGRRLVAAPALSCPHAPTQHMLRHSTVAWTHTHAHTQTHPFTRYRDGKQNLKLPACVRREREKEREGEREGERERERQRKRREDKVEGGEEDRRERKNMRESKEEESRKGRMPSRTGESQMAERWGRRTSSQKVAGSIPPQAN